MKISPDAAGADHMDRLLQRLRSHSPLSDGEGELLRALPWVMRRVDAAAFLVREGEAPEHCSILARGIAIRHKMTGDGRRQIIALHVPGDFIDLHNLLLDRSDHNLQVLTPADIAMVARGALRQLIEEQPGIARALWADTLIDASAFREWTLNVGRRDAVGRIAHLLCEFVVRLERVGLAKSDAFELPMSQMHLADAAGLTPVHVNRVLKALAARGLIERRRRAIVIGDWTALAEAGDFDPRYLHLDQSAKRAAETEHGIAAVAA